MKSKEDEFKKLVGPFDIYLNARGTKLTYPFFPTLYQYDTIYFSYKKCEYFVEFKKLENEFICLLIQSREGQQYYKLRGEEKIEIDKYLWIQITHVFPHVEDSKNKIYLMIHEIQTISVLCCF